ncbi:hypothetical protein ZIOFF_017144 [Zingiber officinale]|uniref:RRM domain-containing protein n=1 Tax=Zingiber officinale TaxID=94328 RepID=A0A8J5HNC1_ZINOF|nr:hypothetical protein ZIOFF_017144 [Zingiber officinale]
MEMTMVKVFCRMFPDYDPADAPDSTIQQGFRQMRGDLQSLHQQQEEMLQQEKEMLQRRVVMLQREEEMLQRREVMLQREEKILQQLREMLDFLRTWHLSQQPSVPSAAAGGDAGCGFFTGENSCNGSFLGGSGIAYLDPLRKLHEKRPPWLAFTLACELNLTYRSLIALERKYIWHLGLGYSHSLSPYRGHSKSRSPPRGLSHSRSRSPLRGRARSRSRSRDREAANFGNTLYVTGLSSRVTERDLEHHFSKEGKIVGCHLVVEPRTRASRGFAFVTMDNVKDADRCIKYLNQSILEGRYITVEKVAEVSEIDILGATAVMTMVVVTRDLLGTLLIVVAMNTRLRDHLIMIAGTEEDDRGHFLLMVMAAHPEHPMGVV